MKQNRPVNLSMGQVLAVNLKSPVAIASILHRLSGVLVFILIPVMLYLLQTSLGSPEGFDKVKNDILGHIGVKLIVWMFVAGLVFHFVAGVKHLLADLGVGETLAGGRALAWLSLSLALVGIVASFVWIVL